ncbi:MAG: glycine cleavage system protein GcvH [Ruthenibacterium sp.]
MNIPANLLYTKSHEWVEKSSDTSARIGLTDYAQDQLGDLVFINLPAVDDAVTAGETFADAESVKAVSDIFSPVSGVVSAVNETLLDTPEAINATPYEAFLIEVSDITEWDDLLDADAYRAICE